MDIESYLLQNWMPILLPQDKDSLVFTGDIRGGLEGTHVYKINGYYYLYCTYGGGDGFQVALRSKNIYGPYEEKIVIRERYWDSSGCTCRNPNWRMVVSYLPGQGPLWTFSYLAACNWQNDWPMVGINGEGVIKYKKPGVGKNYPITVLPTSDEFDSTRLGMQWGWNHNPDSTKWSLTQNPGNLRLLTS